MIFTIVFGTLFAFPFWGTDVLDKLSAVDVSSDPSTIAMAKYFQIVSQLGMFVFPVLIFSFLDGRNVATYLKINFRPRINILLVAGIAIILAVPLINFLSEMNSKMTLPSSFAGMEHWMRDSEDKAGQLTVVFLNVTTIWGFIINLLMIAVIPAIGEEFLFRGVLQPLFHKWTKNIHAAVIVSAFLFSAIHMQFYGFIPRFLMGIFLGYSFAWTGSLWVPVFVHLVNNGTAVILSYLFTIGQSGNTYETIGTGNKAPTPVIISIVLTASAVFLLYYFSKRKREVRLCN
jgi:uncharacterized protein